MSGATTKVTFKVEYSQLAPGERLGLIIWGEFGRLQEIVLATAGRMHFTHPVPLASLDRVEYSYVLLSDSRSPVSCARTRAQHPLPGSETLPSASHAPPYTLPLTSHPVWRGSPPCSGAQGRGDAGAGHCEHAQLC